MKKIFRLLKRLLRISSKWGKTQWTRAIIIYLIGFLPVSNYLTAGLTTATNFTSPTRIVRTIGNSGLLNIATGGLAAPTISSLSEISGSALQKIGGTLGFESWSAKGEELKAKAESYFNQTGGDVIKQAKDLIPSKNVSNNTSSTNDASQPFTGHTDWNNNQYPDYYRVIGKAKIVRDLYPEDAGGVYYSELIGQSKKTGPAYGVITYKMVADSKGYRESFEKDSDPSGWYANPADRSSAWNSKVKIERSGKTPYNGYMYNRSHLVADSLGGRAFRNNLVTGTRTQNVGIGSGGMAYTESKVRDFFKSERSDIVYYSATPIYVGNEIIPRSVIVEMKSSNGELDEEVEVFNAANGYTIDYNTGSFANAF